MTNFKALREKQDACYHKIKATAKVWPSAYASGRLVQCRKRGAANYGKGAKTEDVQPQQEDLRQWFKDKWVRFGPDGKIRGDCARDSESEGKPKCLPQSKAHALGKKGRAQAAARKRREDPNANRSGAAINVRTEQTEDINNMQSDKSFRKIREACWKGYEKKGMKTMFGKSYPNCVPVKEEEQDQDPREYDYEGDMAMSDLRSIMYNAQRLHDMMEKNTNLPEWLQSKITKAEDYISSAANYMQAQMNEELSPENDMGTPALTKKLLKLTPGQTVKESGGDVVYKSGADHIEKYADNSYAVYKDGVKKTFYTTLDAAKQALNEAQAWTRKEGKSPSGGLNAKGIASYRRANPGSKLSMAVTTPPSKLDPDSKPAKRRKSFCARMSGVEGPMEKDGKPTRKALALRKWNC